MNIYKKQQSYTYLIGWSSRNKYYYGCSYNKKANPSQLWVTYFTSSNYVQQFREEYGEPDIIQIRKTFDDPNKCREWEVKVLSKMKAVQDKRFLNKAVNGLNSIDYTDPNVREQATQRLRESDAIGTRIKKTCEWCGKTGQAAAMGMWHFDYCKQNPNRKERHKNWRKKPKRGPETEERKRREYKDRAARARTLGKDTIWWTNGIDSKRLKPEQSPPNGWWRGKVHQR